MDSKNSIERLKKHIIERIQKALKEISNKEQDEIYAYSLLVFDEEDDPRFPSVILGYNTETHFKDQVKVALDEQEARWNFAFWIQNQLLELGTNSDKEGSPLIQEWIRSQDLYYSEEEEKADFETCMQKGDEITFQLIELLVEVVSSLHETQIVNVPVIIHEIEYYDEIAKQNLRANGIDKGQGFAEWVLGMFK